jgi:hypothetical protein
LAQPQRVNSTWPDAPGRWAWRTRLCGYTVERVLEAEQLETTVVTTDTGLVRVCPRAELPGPP